MFSITFALITVGSCKNNNNDNNNIIKHRYHYYNSYNNNINNICCCSCVHLPPGGAAVLWVFWRAAVFTVLQPSRERSRHTHTHTRCGLRLPGLCQMCFYFSIFPSDPELIWHRERERDGAGRSTVPPSDSALHRSLCGPDRAGPNRSWTTTCPCSCLRAW